MPSARLFRSIVLAGTSLGACSNNESVPQASSATASGTGGSASESTGIAAAGTSVIASDASTGSAGFIGAGGAYATGGGGAGGAATSPSACANTEQFECQSYTPTYVGCICDPKAPTSADDCIKLGKQFLFTCYSYNPPIGCMCLIPIH